MTVRDPAEHGDLRLRLAQASLGVVPFLAEPDAGGLRLGEVGLLD
ncbi:MAG TPA: hypothetical protein VHF67_13625 [Gaiellaceae bacterium]|nr:hypothetical protein [Gaiellaceae bacterium]